MLTRALEEAEKTLPPCVQLHSLLRSELGAGLPLHVSLSRTLMLATHQRQPFTDRLQSVVKGSGIKPYVVLLLACLGLLTRGEQVHRGVG